MRRTLLLLLVAACTKDAPSSPPAPQPTPAVAPAPVKPQLVVPAKVAVAATTNPNQLGAPITAGAPTVALADVMKDPAKYKGQAFVTTGTVTAVCQEMGCWMEIKDATGQAHIKMAGEAFSVPKDSAGKTARVQGTLTDVKGNDAECAGEAAKATGKEVAKLQLEATGVEIN
ncbi:MAG TPA: DUF4920 domain-containing protein [Kofleriaceae bacterium]|jgi:hypothetical protein